MEPRVGVGDVVYHMAKHVQRQAATLTEPITLSLGAIVGIACGGGVLVFGLLTFFLMHCARRRHKRRRKAKRRLILDGDEEMEEADTLRGNRLPKTEPAQKSHENAFQPGPLAKNATHLDDKVSYRANDSTTTLLPPSYAYQITGLRDSWPLVSWTQSPTVPLTSEGQVYNPASGTTTTYAQTGTPLQAKAESHHAVPTLQAPTQAAQRQISPARIALHRRSTSDTQLTSILHSTSQRLRETKSKRPMSRTISVLSQLSGQPPNEQLPAPPRGRERMSRERVSKSPVEREYEESVKSSVLEMFSEDSSPAKQHESHGHSIATDLTQKGKRPSHGDGSDDDSLYGDTPEMVKQAALTSPSKRRLRADRTNMGETSTGSPVSIKIREDKDNRTSISAFGGRDIFAHRRTSSSQSNGDPFVDRDSKSGGDRKPSSSRPNFIRKATFGNGSTNEDSGDISTQPLRSVSGNKPQEKAGSKPNTPTLAVFDWSKEPEAVLKTSPNPQKPTIQKRKGHARSKTIRLSGLQTHRSVSVLAEETEDEASPPGAIRHTTTRVVTQPPPTVVVILPTPGSPSSTYSKQPGSARPGSTARFIEELAPPIISHPSVAEDLTPDSTLRDDKARAHSSYSATLSFYDYYSSSEASNANAESAAEQQQSEVTRSPDMKKKSRHGRDFSVSDPNDASALVFPPPMLPGLTDGSDATAHPTPVQDAPFVPTALPSIADMGAGFTVSPISISRLHGPRSQPQLAARDSIQASVAQLRRMNSTISAYSNAGSVASDGSPTLPVLRGGGVSPYKRGGPKGNRNYLKIDVSRSRLDGREDNSPITRGGPIQKAMQEAKERAELEEKSDQRQISYATTSPALNSLHSTSDVLTPDKDLYDGFTPTRSLSTISSSPQLAELATFHSSGLKIQGLRLPFRDRLGSPVRNIFAQNEEQQQYQSPSSQSGGKWSGATAQPHCAMIATRHESRLIAPSAMNVTPPRWGSGWEKSVEASSQPKTAAQSPVYSKPNSALPSPMRASFEKVVEESPLGHKIMPGRDGSFESPRLVPSTGNANAGSLRTGGQGIRGVQGPKGRMEELKWDSNGGMNSNGVNDNVISVNSSKVSKVEASSRDSWYDEDGFLRSSSERTRPNSGFNFDGRNSGTGSDNMI